MSLVRLRLHTFDQRTYAVIENVALDRIGILVHGKKKKIIITGFALWLLGPWLLRSPAVKDFKNNESY